MQSLHSISSDGKIFSADHIEYLGKEEEIIKGPIYKISTITGDDEFVVIGNHKYDKNKLKKVFSTTVQDTDPVNYLKHKIGNPVCIALIATCMNIFVMGLFFAGAKGIQTPNVAISLCMFMGGAVQYVAGVSGFFRGGQEGTFIFCAFVSYGSFWLSFGAIYIPAFGIQDAYGDDTVQLNEAIGYMSIGWAIFTTMLLVASLKTTLSLFWSLLSLDMAIILFASGFTLNNNTIIKAGGIFGVIHAFSGWYQAFEGMTTSQNSYWDIKEVQLPDLSKYFKRKKN